MSSYSVHNMKDVTVLRQMSTTCLTADILAMHVLYTYSLWVRTRMWFAVLWSKEAKSPYISSNKTHKSSLFEWLRSYVMLDIWFERAGRFSSAAIGEEEKEEEKEEEENTEE